MDIVIFGLSISSSWGNGHATLWRSLIQSLIDNEHRIHFFERDVPYYAENRDLWSMQGLELILYKDWQTIRAYADARIRAADATIITSYCPDAIVASELMYNSSSKLKVFYDLDTPITLNTIAKGKWPEYVCKECKLQYYDLAISYTGGNALDLLKSELSAKRTYPLYGSVDPKKHFPVPPVPHYRCDLSYLGTYASDRQRKLKALFVQSALNLPEQKFVIAGAQYPPGNKWPSNVQYHSHIAPPDHSPFYCSSRFTLNLTRQPMGKMGYCPSGRLFEAASCGVPVITDKWEGLDEFFTPGEEINVVICADDVKNVLELSEQERVRFSKNARERVMNQHTSKHRADQLIKVLEDASA